MLDLSVGVITIGRGVGLRSCLSKHWLAEGEGVDAVLRVGVRILTDWGLRLPSSPPIIA